MKRGTLYVKVDGEFVPVAPCTVEIRDGGVFAFQESSATKRGDVTWRRIGTLPDRVLEKFETRDTEQAA